MRAEGNTTSQIMIVSNWSEPIQEAGQTFELKNLDPKKASELVVLELCGSCVRVILCRHARA